MNRVRPLLLIGCVVAASCSSTDGGNGPTTTSPTEQPAFPFNDRIEVALGVDPGAVQSRLLAARLGSTRDCLAERGYDGGSLSWLPQPFDPLNTAPQYYVPYSTTALAQLSSPPQSEAAAGDDPPTDLHEASNACYRDATDEIADPLEPYWIWVLQAMNDLEDRVTSLPESRVVADAFEECLRSNGFDATNESKIQNDFAERVDVIQRAQIAGEIDLATARSRLEDVQSQEIPAANVVQKCVAAREDALQRVRAPLESEFLDENATTFAEYAEAAKRLLADLPTQ